MNTTTEVQKLAKLMRKYNIGVLKAHGLEIFMNPEIPRLEPPRPVLADDKSRSGFEFGEPIVRKEDLEGPFPTN